MKIEQVRRSRKTKIIQASINLLRMFRLVEALGEISLPLSQKIVGTDRSHTDAGSGAADLIACRSVAKDSPILGRLFTLLPSSFYVVPGRVLTAHLFLYTN